MSDEDAMEDTIGYRIVTSVAALAAGWLAQKILVSAWKAITGNDAPQDPDDDSATLVGVVGFAAATGAVAALARALASRSVKSVAARSAQRRGIGA
ncbi:DUF4235 domain-containing protein [Rarobacter incanus]|uniref:Uncharacterized protein DUF4235 n=1 Tax=Rarobacter incanus TaxID=153494 RepID=A0A542SPF5_9MICO|nr:DUF4235 domain-containing protein [Rarobacter incanus]TQK76504.1 uncharacterized protein DUF4235 [Rarobacter incanus]